MKINAADLPGVNPLYVDYLRDFSRLRAFFHLPYNSEQAVRQLQEKHRHRTYPFAALGEALVRQNRQFGAGERTFENLQKLAAGKACAIVTGQQVGLFGGCLFVLYKALTAAKLADRLNRQSNGCFVPVFWLASDDSDFEEVNHIRYLTRDHAVTALEVQKNEPGNLPMSQVHLDAKVVEAVATLSDGLQESEFKDEIFAALRQAYAPGRTMSFAFGTWLIRWLRDFGIIFIDPSDPAIKRLVAGLFQQEIDGRSPSTREVLAASEGLEKAGYAPQVHLRDERLNLFYTEKYRKALEMQNGGIRTTDGTAQFRQEELARIAEKTPERLSPNVVLRPLMQDTLFPTIAYVAGPGEIAYFAQLKTAYEHFGVPMPIIYPRKSLTIIEPSVDRILDKYDLSIHDVWRGIDRFISAYTRKTLPEALTAPLAEMQKRWPQELLHLRDEIERLDPTLVKNLENTAFKAGNLLGNLEKKIVQAGKRRNEIFMTQLKKVQAALYPDHALQERVLNFTPFLVKFGPEFIEKIYEILDLTSFDHQIVRL